MFSASTNSSIVVYLEPKHVQECQLYKRLKTKNRCVQAYFTAYIDHGENESFAVFCRCIRRNWHFPSKAFTKVKYQCVISSTLLLCLRHTDTISGQVGFDSLHLSLGPIEKALSAVQSAEKLMAVQLTAIGPSCHSTEYEFIKIVQSIFCPYIWEPENQDFEQFPS